MSVNPEELRPFWRPREGKGKKEKAPKGWAVSTLFNALVHDTAFVELEEDATGGKAALPRGEWPYYSLVHDAYILTMEGIGKSSCTAMGNPQLSSILLLLKICRPLRLKKPEAWMGTEGGVGVLFNYADESLISMFTGQHKAVDTLGVLVPYQVALRQIVRGEEVFTHDRSSLEMTHMGVELTGMWYVVCGRQTSTKWRDGGGGTSRGW